MPHLMADWREQKSYLAADKAEIRDQLNRGLKLKLAGYQKIDGYDDIRSRGMKHPDLSRDVLSTERMVEALTDFPVMLPAEQARVLSAREGLILESPQAPKSIEATEVMRKLHAGSVEAYQKDPLAYSMKALRSTLKPLDLNDPACFDNCRIQRTAAPGLGRSGEVAVINTFV